MLVAAISSSPCEGWQSICAPLIVCSAGGSRHVRGNLEQGGRRNRTKPPLAPELRPHPPRR
eukprot:5439708-Pyramimonas_sp.AAC.1